MLRSDQRLCAAILTGIRTTLGAALLLGCSSSSTAPGVDPIRIEPVKAAFVPGEAVYLTVSNLAMPIEAFRCARLSLNDLRERPGLKSLVSRPVGISG